MKPVWEEYFLFEIWLLNHKLLCMISWFDFTFRCLQKLDQLWKTSFQKGFSFAVNLFHHWSPTVTKESRCCISTDSNFNQQLDIFLWSIMRLIQFSFIDFSKFRRSTIFSLPSSKGWQIMLLLILSGLLNHKYSYKELFNLSSNFWEMHCKNKLVIATKKIGENGYIQGTHPLCVALPGNLLFPVPKKFAVMSNCYLNFFVPVMTFFRFVQMFQQLILSTINPKFCLL